MSDIRVDVYLLSETQPGVSRLALARNLAAAFKKDMPVIEKMLSRPRYLIKKDADKALAEKYQAVIQKAGGVCELTAHQPDAPVVETSPVASASHNSTSPYSAPVAEMGEQLACYRCGTLLQDPTQANCPRCYAPRLQLTAKNKTLAGLLAFFVGGFGAHRIYLGQWRGLLYLFFWMTLIPSLLSIIEALVFWLTPAERWQRKYGLVPKTTGALVVVYCCSFFIWVAQLGIVAAVALPAYQDYTYRAKVQSAMPLVEDMRAKVVAYHQRTGELPASHSDLGLPDKITSEVLTSLVLNEAATIEATFNLSLPQSGKTMIWSPSVQGGELVWSCTGGTLADRFRMSSCRGGSGATSAVTTREQAPSSTQAVSPLTQELFSDDQGMSLRVPANWQSRKSLSPDASIGAANLFEEGYVIVMEEPKDTFGEVPRLGEYTQVVSTQMQSLMKDPRTLGKLRQLQINGLPAEQMALTGQIDEISITYLLTTLESDESFYQVLSWTLSSRFKAKQKQLGAISRTFVVHQPE